MRATSFRHNHKLIPSSAAPIKRPEGTASDRAQSGQKGPHQPKKSGVPEAGGRTHAAELQALPYDGQHEKPHPPQDHLVQGTSSGVQCVAHQPADRAHPHDNRKGGRLAPVSRPVNRREHRGGKDEQASSHARYPAHQSQGTRRRQRRRRGTTTRSLRLPPFPD